MAVTLYTPTGISHSTSVDFSKRAINQPVHLVQYDDTLPILAVSLLNNGQLYRIPDDANVSIRFGKPDKTFVYNKCLGCNKERTIVYFEVTVQMTVIPGEYYPIIEISNNDGSASSSTIYMIVDRNPIQHDYIVSSVEFTELVSYRNEAKEFANSANEAKQQAENFASLAEQSALDAKNAAETSLDAAKNANDAKSVVLDAESKVLEYAELAKEASQKADIAKENAATSEHNAKISENNAKQYYEISKSNAEECVSVVDKLTSQLVFRARGEYNPDKTYEPLDWVRYEYRSWVCAKQCQGIEPNEENSLYWRILAEDGKGAIPMKGATASSDGESGAVPKPKIQDRDKFLRGDGTWQEADSSNKADGKGIGFYVKNGRPYMTYTYEVEVDGDPDIDEIIEDIWDDNPTNDVEANPDIDEIVRNIYDDDLSNDEPSTQDVDNIIKELFGS